MLAKAGGSPWESFLKEGTWFRPRLFDFYSQASLVTFDPTVVLRDALHVPDLELSQILEECRKITSTLDSRRKGQDLEFPSEWAVASSTGLLLYGLVRAIAPEVVVETGVANGVSSYYILEALGKNGKGRLVSFDIHPTAGGLLGPSQRSRWTFVTLPTKGTQESLANAVASLPPVDLAFTDADHSYPGQMWEYRVFWERLRPGSWLFSDDVDWSYAFLDFSTAKGVRPRIHVTELKVTGLLRVEKDAR
jgi:predicted O-methyltransferase YrrM